MGIGATKPAARSNQIRPVTAISVRPAQPEDAAPSSPSNHLSTSINSNANNNSSLNSISLKSNLKDSSDDTLKKSPSRQNSSRRSSLSKSSNIRSGVPSGLRSHSANKRFGGASRPISGTRQPSAGRGVAFRGLAGAFDKLPMSPTSGLPFQGDLDSSYDFNASHNWSHHFDHFLAHPDADVIILGRNRDHNEEKMATNSQLCDNPFTNLGIRVPLLLLFLLRGFGKSALSWWDSNSQQC